LVEQRTENPRVPSSILGLGTTQITGGSSSVVERLLAKEEVASSNLVFRSISFFSCHCEERSDVAISMIHSLQ
jgi:hypothetical protein